MELIETIRVDNGIAENTILHQQRMHKAYYHLFGKQLPFDLVNVIDRVIDKNDNGLKKCRVVYDENSYNIEIKDYIIRPVNLLKMIEDNDIDYRYKFADRSKINRLFEKKGQADDVVILKNGFITDSSYANLLFFNGSTWVTPEIPLLYGIQRQKLINEKKIITANISPVYLSSFTKVRLVNAMIRMEDELDIDVANIIF